MNIYLYNNLTKLDLYVTCVKLLAKKLGFWIILKKFHENAECSGAISLYILSVRTLSPPKQAGLDPQIFCRHLRV
jgi:hypothetical protein